MLAPPGHGRLSIGQAGLVWVADGLGWYISTPAELDCSPCSCAPAHELLLVFENGEKEERAEARMLSDKEPAERGVYRGYHGKKYARGLGDTRGYIPHLFPFYPLECRARSSSGRIKDRITRKSATRMSFLCILGHANSQNYHGSISAL